MSENENDTEFDNLCALYEGLAQKARNLMGGNLKENLPLIEKCVDIMDKLEDMTCLGAASIYWMKNHVDDEDDICDACREAMEEAGEGGVEA